MERAPLIKKIEFFNYYEAQLLKKLERLEAEEQAIPDESQSQSQQPECEEETKHHVSERCSS
jgi:hypothetical protein